MFKAPFDFSGRIRRKEYGISLIVFVIAINGMEIMMKASGALSFLELMYIPFYWFIMAQGVKRCHDKNKPGWYQIIPFYIFLMLFSEGDQAENEYGTNPKELEQLQQNSSSG